MNSFDPVEFIFDYITEDIDIFNENVILETIKDQLKSIAQKIATSSDQDLPSLEEEIINYAKRISAPYWKWVVNQIAKGNIRIDRESDSRLARSPFLNIYDEYIKPLSAYSRLVASKELPIEYRDINRVGSIDELKDIISSYVSQTANELKRYGELLAVNNDYALLRVTDPRSIEQIGHNTAWCTRGDHPQCRSENYIEDFGYLYVVMTVKDTGTWKPYIQFTPDLAEVQDTKKYNFTYPLMEVLFSLNLTDEELIIDLMQADSFILLLKRHNDEDYKNRIIDIYLDAMTSNYKDTKDNTYLDKIKWTFRYFQLDSPEDKKRLEQINDMFYDADPHIESYDD